MEFAATKPVGTRLNTRTALALAIACSASVAVVVAALAVHQGGETSIVGSSLHASHVVAQPKTTFVQQNGVRGLFFALLPLLATLVVAVALWFRSPERSGPGPYATTTAAVLVVVGLLGILSIGPFVLPIALLVLYACATVSGPPMFRRAVGNRVDRP
jgi:hypothetical protein